MHCSRQGRLYKPGYGDSLGSSASGCLWENTPQTNAGLMGHVTLAALRRPSGKHTAQLDLGERINGRQECWLVFVYLTHSWSLLQEEGTSNENSLHSVEAFSQLFTGMGKYIHIRPSPGPFLGKIISGRYKKKS